MKVVFTGKESQGKSLALAQKSIYLVNRNKKWFKKWGFKRPIYSNLKFSNSFYNANKDYIFYWDEMNELFGLSGVDIIWDEISTDFPAQKEPLPTYINKWLRQGAKQGIHIYATAQELHDVHLQYRRRINLCINYKKFIGSDRSGKNLPKIDVIWGVCFGYNVDINPYNELEPKYNSSFPFIDYLFITPMLCNIFDTSQVIIPSESPNYEHIVRKCKVCSYTRIIHK